MNAGIIASRYAKAFLKYVQENGAGNDVYSQACVLVRHMNELPRLKEYIQDASDVSMEKKQALMSSALGAPVHASIAHFLKMVTNHRRIEYFPRMLLSFIEQYRRENNIKVGRIVTASCSDGVRERLEEVFQDKTGAQVHLDEKVDPEIIGGFIFELEGYRVDGSVNGELKRIRRQLVEKNTRIV